MIAERILAILKAVSYGEMASYEMETCCLHCSIDEDDRAADTMNVRHNADCPVTLARTLLRENETPLYLYKITLEEAWAQQDNWGDNTQYRFAFSEDEIRSHYPERRDRKNRRVRNVRIAQLEQAR